MPVVEIESEPLLGQTQSLGSSHHVSQSLQQVQYVVHLSPLKLRQQLVDVHEGLLVVGSQLLAALEQLGLLHVGLVHLDQDDDQGEEKTKEPEESGTFGSFLLVDTCEVLDFSKDGEIVEDPVEEEACAR